VHSRLVKDLKNMKLMVINSHIPHFSDFFNYISKTEGILDFSVIWTSLFFL
jgi:hypothetical protein